MDTQWISEPYLRGSINGGTQNGLFIVENPIKMEETSIVEQKLNVIGDGTAIQTLGPCSNPNLEVNRASYLDVSVHLNFKGVSQGVELFQNMDPEYA